MLGIFCIFCIYFAYYLAYYAYSVMYILCILYIYIYISLAYCFAYFAYFAVHMEPFFCSHGTFFPFIYNLRNMYHTIFSMYTIIIMHDQVMCCILCIFCKFCIFNCQLVSIIMWVVLRLGWLNVISLVV